MIQQDTKIKTFEQINNLLELMDRLNEIELDCKRYTQSVDNSKLNSSFQTIREVIALNHYTTFLNILTLFYHF